MGHIQEKQEQQEPRRTQYAIEQLTALGYEVTEVATQRMLTFTHKGATVRLYPYSGWFTGKTVKDGRGIHKLIKQLKNGK